MVLSLIGIIRGISPSVVEASWSLGASPNKTFWSIIEQTAHFPHAIDLGAFLLVLELKNGTTASYVPFVL